MHKRVVAIQRNLDHRSPIVYCASGVRSSIAASLLRAKGFRLVADILGGYGAWKAGQPPNLEVSV